MGTGAAHRARLGLWLALGCLPALAGFALSYAPYRLAGVIAPPRVGRHDTLLGTAKLIAGAALVLIGWLLAALVLGLLAGGWWALALLVLAPLVSYTALRWGEHWRELRAALAYSWLRTRHQTLTQHLVGRRLALTQQVLAAMARAATLPEQVTDGRVQPASTTELAG